MISAWWLVPTFLVGGYAGMLVMAILSAAREVTREPFPKRAVRARLRSTADAA
jgi:RsiW-degrading membrane proteinase PrsW (M82 family)